MLSATNVTVTIWPVVHQMASGQCWEFYSSRGGILFKMNSEARPTNMEWQDYYDQCSTNMKYPAGNERNLLSFHLLRNPATVPKPLQMSGWAVSFANTLTRLEITGTPTFWWLLWKGRCLTLCQKVKLMSTCIRKEIY